MLGSHNNHTALAAYDSTDNTYDANTTHATGTGTNLINKVANALSGNAHNNQTGTHNSNPLSNNSTHTAGHSVNPFSSNHLTSATHSSNHGTTASTNPLSSNNHSIHGGILDHGASHTAPHHSGNNSLTSGTGFGHDHATAHHAEHNRHTGLAAGTPGTTTTTTSTTVPKPSVADKVGGKIDVLIGKATHNPEKVAIGEIKQSEGKAGLTASGLGGVSGAQQMGAGHTAAHPRSAGPMTGHDAI